MGDKVAEVGRSAMPIVLRGGGGGRGDGEGDRVLSVVCNELHLPPCLRRSQGAGSVSASPKIKVSLWWMFIPGLWKSGHREI